CDEQDRIISTRFVRNLLRNLFRLHSHLPALPAGVQSFLWKLETYIGARADPHQPYKGGLKIWHGQLKDHAPYENEPEDDSPNCNLKSMEAYPFAISQHIN